MSKYLKINRKTDNNCNILKSFTIFCNGLTKIFLKKCKRIWITCKYSGIN